MLPLTFIDATTGKPIMNVAYQGNFNQIEFNDQFNEYLMVKRRDKPLKLHNTFTGKNTYIEDFATPNAFIHIYDRDIMLAIYDNVVHQYNILTGELITNYNEEKLFSETVDDLGNKQ